MGTTLVVAATGVTTGCNVMAGHTRPAAMRATPLTRAIQEGRLRPTHLWMDVIVRPGPSRSRTATDRVDYMNVLVRRPDRLRGRRRTRLDGKHDLAREV